jgi:hypothetical protein
MIPCPDLVTFQTARALDALPLTPENFQRANALLRNAIIGRRCRSVRRPRLSGYVLLMNGEHVLHGTLPGTSPIAVVRR